MGLFFTLLYIFTACMSPRVLFGSLAEYHVQVVLGGLALLFTAFSMNSNLFKLPQTLGVVGMSSAVFLSLLFNGWAGGAVLAVLDFEPQLLTFLFVYLNCRTRRHLQLVVISFVIPALFTVFQGVTALRANLTDSPYLFSMTNSAGDLFYRIRGNSFLNDPNDLGQFLVACVPCVWLLWKKGSAIANFFFVYLPAGLLLYGMFLTHSRGAMVGLLLACIVAGRRKIGLLPAAIVAGVLFLGLTAIGWSGGRDVSAAAGEDRMSAWSAGLQMIKSHPLFGVGFKGFSDYYPITAHNTVVVCAAETGLVGFFFWMLFVLPTFRDAAIGSGNISRRANPKPADADSLLPWQVPALAAGFADQIAPAPLPAETMQRNITSGVLTPEAKPEWSNPVGNFRDEARAPDVSDAEIQRISGSMLVALAGYLTSGWFLSRAFTLPLFVFAGMASVVYGMAVTRGIAAPPLRLRVASRLSFYACFAILTALYILLRLSGGGS